MDLDLYLDAEQAFALGAGVFFALGVFIARLVYRRTLRIVLDDWRTANRAATEARSQGARIVPGTTEIRRFD